MNSCNQERTEWKCEVFHGPVQLTYGHELEAVTQEKNKITDTSSWNEFAPKSGGLSLREAPEGSGGTAPSCEKQSRWLGRLICAHSGQKNECIDPTEEKVQHKTSA